MLRKHTHGSFFLDVLPELDSFDTFMTLFGQFENVFSTQGEFQKQSNSGLEATSKQPRIISFHLASGRHIQLNRVEGKDSSPYLTKVDALQILPFTSCQLVILVPPYIELSHTPYLINAAVNWSCMDLRNIY